MATTQKLEEKTLNQLNAMRERCAKRTGVLADPIMLNIIDQEIASRGPAVTCPQCEGAPDLCNGYCESTGMVTTNSAEEWHRQNDDSLVRTIVRKADPHPQPVPMTEHQMKNIGLGNDPDASLAYGADIVFAHLATPIPASVTATSEAEAMDILTKVTFYANTTPVRPLAYTIENLRIL